MCQLSLWHEYIFQIDKSYTDTIAYWKKVLYIYRNVNNFKIGFVRMQNLVNCRMYHFGMDIYRDGTVVDCS